MGSVQAGVSRVTITPPVGIYLIGFAGRAGGSRGAGTVTHVLPEGARPVDYAGESWPFELPGFTGILFEWRGA